MPASSAEKPLGAASSLMAGAIEDLLDEGKALAVTVADDDELLSPRTFAGSGVGPLSPRG